MSGMIQDNVREYLLIQLTAGHDAFDYFTMIRIKFLEKPHTYKYFVGIINEYKHGRVGIVGLIQRIRILFEDHPELIERFNNFLPPGHRIVPIERDNE